MNKQSLRIQGPAGAIETVLEEPAGAPRGLALVAHPHPLHGGSLDNKVAWTLARAALACGLVAIRPNFRGVGKSEGTFDHGVGETEDLLAVVRAMQARYGALPWTLLGFSFGAYVQQRLARHLAAQRLILVAPAVSLYEFAPPATATVILHGDRDEVVPFAAAQAYAEAHAIPLVVLADCGHFFHGRLRTLQEHVERLLCRP